jgi:TonB family protein
VAAFLAEDAARERVAKGVVPPRLRDLERALEQSFAPPVAHVDVANRGELLHKQLVGRLRTPPTLRALPRGEDATRETNAEKLKRVVAEPFFLGRRVEVFVRQRADGTILEIALRQSSGFRAFDDEALDAVEKALAGRPPEDARSPEVRSLWRLDATAYVVYSPTPTLVFDEATGKQEWIYPLEKRVKTAVQLVAVY